MSRRDTWSNDEFGAASAAQDFATDWRDHYDPYDDEEELDG